MKDNNYYFPHDYDPLGDLKVSAMVSEFGAEGYGLLWRFYELLHIEPSHKLPLKNFTFLAVARQLSTTVERVKEFVKSCIDTFEIFISDNVFFWSERVFRNLDKRQKLIDQRKQAGKASAEARKAKKIEQEIQEKYHTTVERNLTTVERNPTKERKGKEIKYNNYKSLNNSLFLGDSEKHEQTQTQEPQENSQTETKKNEEPEKIPQISEKKGYKAINDIEFRESLSEYEKEFSTPLICDFYDYWSEKNTKGVMRFQLQETWDVKRRLQRWQRNNAGKYGAQVVSRYKSRNERAQEALALAMVENEGSDIELFTRKKIENLTGG